MKNEEDLILKEIEKTNKRLLKLQEIHKANLDRQNRLLTPRERTNELIKKAR